MRAMILPRVVSLADSDRPLQYVTDSPQPQPAADELLLRVAACGVCHTELDEIEGRTSPARLPMILGHEVVGYVADVGADVTLWRRGDRGSHEDCCSHIR